MLKLKRNEERIIICIIIILLLGVIIYRFAVFKADSVEVVKGRESQEENVGDDAPSDICVYITGEVKMPGVYMLEDGGRVADAVEAAGGFTEDADTTSVNLAERTMDEQYIHIGSKNSAPGIEGQSNNHIVGGRININTATADELDAFLPGVGETIANNIVSYREKHGRFKSIDEITRVDRIGSGKTFERIKDLITVN